MTLIVQVLKDGKEVIYFKTSEEKKVTRVERPQLPSIEFETQKDVASTVIEALKAIREEDTSWKTAMEATPTEEQIREIFGETPSY